ncbi:NAD(P)-binding protein [Gymnopus androsaceus JB14]|uniref:NAD(P)-binding protein n=1 Tax=Gymnopus androsaceus JB14 TaxID=1447944 RepID=A0A6A4GZQ0_9AGAR|nr:NAD(P)-binding protein [Gymnopus androsaceus JB14]
MSLKNIIQVGATGTLGPSVLQALIASNKFNVTVGTRDASGTFPAGVKVVQIDYSSQESLVKAFSGQDAVIVTIGNHNPALLEEIQMAIVDAAVTAGVKHLIPSNFGGDLEAHRTDVLDFKIRVEEKLAKLASEGKISYTAIGTGIFFDWALMIGFLGVDLTTKKASLLNDGNFKLNVTKLSTVAQVIIKILSSPETVKNRRALVHDFYISQRELLKVAEEETGAIFEVSSMTTEELLATSLKAMGAGDPMAIYGLIKAAAWGADSPTAWGVDDDSKVLEVVPKDLREEVVVVLTQMKLR